MLSWAITVIALDAAKASMDIQISNKPPLKAKKKNCKEYFIDIKVLLNSCKQLYKIKLSLRAFFKSKNKNLDINAS